MRVPRLALRLAPLLPLGACVGNLLGGGSPAQLYQLEPAAPAADIAPSQQQVAVRLATIEFAPAIAGDRILVVNGQRALYLKDARWVAAAPELFGQALRTNFVRNAPSLLLTSDRALGALAVLQVRITHFEAIYTGSAADTPPVVRIAGEALLLDPHGRALVAEQRFVSEVPATDNRVGAIVAAFGKASDELLGKLARWCQSSANRT